MPEEIKRSIGDKRTDFENIRRDMVSRAEAAGDGLLELSISSDTPIEDFPGEFLALDHSPNSVRMERIQTAGVGRDRHDGPQVCAVERAELDANKLRVAVRFCSDENSQNFERDSREGTRKNVSVDAKVHAAVLVELRDDGSELWRAIDWEPLGFAFEPYPADISVGVTRSAESEPKIKRKKAKPMPEETTQTDEQSVSIADLRREIEAEVRRDVESQVRDNAISNVTANAVKVLELGEKYNCPDLAREAIQKGWPIEEFQGKLIERGTEKKAPVGRQSADADRIGCTDDEAQQFSILRAARTVFAGKPLDGIEGEMSAAVAKQIGRECQAHGFFVPKEVRRLQNIVQGDVSRHLISRAMTAGNFLTGGATVPDQMMDMIELLRNMALVFAMGARRMDDIVGDIVFPRQTSGSTITDKSETGTSLETTLGTDDIKGTPHRLTAFIEATRQLLAQSSQDVEAWIREDLMVQTALKLDFNALFGTGADAQPIGIANTTGVGGVTFGAAATREKIIEFETDVNVANALMGMLGYVTSPAAAGKLKNKAVDAGSGKFVWEGSVIDGILNNYKAMSSNQIPATGTYANRMIFGNWRDLLILFWAGTEIIVDPYSNKKDGKIDIQIERMYDIVVRHAESFSVSTDSAAQ
jgi:HK97 family phage major capsid protein